MAFRCMCKCHHYVEYASSSGMSGATFKTPYHTGKRFQKVFLGVQQYSQGSTETLSVAYHPPDVEQRVQEFWNSKHMYQQKNKQKSTETFSMILPPPNVTGVLHLGHSLTVTIQDVLIRWHRMQGKRVLWIPGLDHAGIATQSAFEKKLWKEKRQTRYDLGRKTFEEEIWNWKNEKDFAICDQLRSMGASLDWSRQYFTLDPKHSKIVADTFIKLFSDGLIYRSNGIVNWCCGLQSAISDIEVDHVEVEGPTFFEVPSYDKPVEFGLLTSVAYKSPDGVDELVISTTRLETMLGDTAVAVHPSDERYFKWHGAQLWHPVRKTLIPVICDESVDPKFGTGVVKVTPAHSRIDYEMGKRHNLEFLSVINEKGEMNENSGKYMGQKRFNIRKLIKDELMQLGHFRNEVKHAMSVPVCSRTKDVVEFLLKPQWFLSCQEMSKLAIAAVESGELSITPSSYNKVWFSWLHNIRDWCISRQLWWGHRIPAYHCTFPGHSVAVWVAAQNAEEAKHKAVYKMRLDSEERDQIIVTQDSDVLDTWFSSALLPFSSLGWPHWQTEDMKEFYPLSMMETGHDILFFWVARMVMLGCYLTGKVPFKQALLHGIVCDSNGRKMSKSLGNVIDPQDVINGASAQQLMENAHRSYDFGLISPAELHKTLNSNKEMFPYGIPECGSDALRFTLCSQNITNVHINFDVRLCHKNRHFCNKMWQACRYIEKHYNDIFSGNKTLENAPRSKFDKWIISRLAYLVVQVDEALSSGALHTATDVLKNFIYDEFCSTYLEGTKHILKSHDASSVTTMEILTLCMDVALRVLSPFMPFLTEHLYQHIPSRKEMAFVETITLAPFPSPQEWALFRDEIIEEEMKNILVVVSTIRHMKAIYEITKKDDPKGFIICQSDSERKQYRDHRAIISALTNVPNIEVTEFILENVKEKAINMALGSDSAIYLEISKKKDKTKELLEKAKRYKVLVKDLEKLQKLISHPKYSIGAPEKVQKKHMQKIARLETEINELRKYQEQLELKTV